MSFPSLYVLTLSKEAWVVDLWDEKRIIRIHVSLDTLNNWELNIVETFFFSRLQYKLVKREENDMVVGWI